MVKGVAVAFAIMLAAIPIPIVHFVLIPVSPFIAGFIGGGIARADEMRIIWFGLILGGLMFIPALAGIVAWAVLDAEEILGIPTGVALALGIGLVPYAWFGSTLGALASYYFRQRGESSVGTDAQAPPRAGDADC